MRLRLLLFAAASPVCLSLDVAKAETTISTAVTSPVATATAAGGAPDDLKIASGGSVTTSGGAAVTLNSDNDVANAGTIAIRDADGATGVLVTGGTRGDVNNTGKITVDESAEPKDIDGDGDQDGKFATGTGRFGVRVTGPAPFHGSITSGGSIMVEGQDSAAIAVETAMDGSIRTGGVISVVGDRSYGVHALGAVGGEVSIRSTVAVVGEGAVGVATDGSVAGRLVIGNAVTATGFRYTSRPAEKAVAALDADDLLIGGAAVRVRGDVGGGLLIDAPPKAADPNDADEDKDGVADADKTTGAVIAYGSAPAVLVGSGGAIRLGVGGAGADAYGVNIKGSAQGVGVYDGVAATGVQLGGLGGRVDIDGGVRVSGLVAATAVRAEATALRLAAGAHAPELRVEGGAIRAVATSDDALAVRAVRIDAGASAQGLVNTGEISATLNGVKGAATAVLDASGTLSLVENRNLISAKAALAGGRGTAVALDLRANTGGVTVRQDMSASTAIVPTIIGDVLFGAGAARLDLLAGVLTGDVQYGAGGGSLTIDGGAQMTGALRDGGGPLTLDIAHGRLTASNIEAITLTSLSIGAAGELILTADPSAAKSGTLNVAGTANLASGAKLGLKFASKLTDPTTFTLIKAGTLVTGDLDEGLLAATPWLYKTELKVDGANNALLADVRRRTAAEAGLNAAEAAAYDAVFVNFDRNATLRDALLAKTDAASFARLYDQFLPDFTGSLFHTLAAASDAANRALDESPGRLVGDGARVWTQEIAFLVKRDVDRTTNYDADGFGLAAGAEAPLEGVGTLGVSTSFVNVSVDDAFASAAESLGGQVYSAGVYWRDTAGGLTASLGLNGGYAKLKSTRTLSEPSAGLNLQAKSDWSGVTLAAHAGLSYLAEFGRYFVRPLLSADYFLLKEDGRAERGGGQAMDLSIDARSSNQVAGFVGVALGARFGEQSGFAWAPELTAGWRQVGGQGPDATTARFLAGGPAFELAAPDLSGGGPVVRLALRGQGEYFDFALEGGGEFRDDYAAYDARVAVRFAF